MVTLLRVNIAALLYNKISATHLSIAFIATGMSTEDLHTVAIINKIALTSNLMTRLLEGSRHSKEIEVAD